MPPGPGAVAARATVLRHNGPAMPDSSAPDFRLYHSNALDVLAGLLAEELRRPVPGMSPLQPDVVLIPQPAMRRWLQATLAERHGIVANIEFLAPGEFVSRVLDANIGGADGDLDTAALHWRLYAALTDARLLEQPALATIRHHVAGGGGNIDALRAWTLAGELAGVYEKYQAWRRHWLMDWEHGGGADDPQAILWRAAIAGFGSRARRIQAYLDGFTGEGRPLPRGMPPRLFAFATINVSPDVLRIIASHARVGVTHFYMPSPTGNYWGDMQRLRRLPPEDDDPLAQAVADNRLLQAWGAAGRDFVALLGSYEVVHPSGEVEAYADPENGPEPPMCEGGLRDSLLHRLQADLFHRRPPPPPGPTPEDPRERLPSVRRDDPSLQVHACHTRLRELQVLHDRLRALFDDTRFKPPLQPRDVAVLAPDIDGYLPYLEAVFGGGSDGQRIPWTVADTSPLAAEPMAEVFLHLLGLPVSRFGLGEILDLLASPPVAEAARLGMPALESLRTWLEKAGARWGLDPGHRAAHQVPPDDLCTWRFALERLLLGHATGSDDAVAAPQGLVAPLPDLEGGDLEALDVLLRYLRRLEHYRRAMAQARRPAEWRELLLAMMRELLPTEPADAAGRRALQRLHALVAEFARQAERARFDAPVPFELVREHFTRRLGEADTRAPLLSGGVSFARMVPMRLLPFRVICVLGMNDGDYPRRDPAAGLSRLAARRGAPGWQRGDRSLRDDDRFLFLQLFAAARDVFYVSYLGADPVDGTARMPSPLVSELLDEAARHHAEPRQALEDLVVRHPLQPFSPAAFGDQADPRHFSYRASWHQAARALTEGAWEPVPPRQNGRLPAPAREEQLDFHQLRRFLLEPARCFLEQRLGLRLAQDRVGVDDDEPLTAPAYGLERYALEHEVFDALLRGGDNGLLYATLRARAMLPSGRAGWHGLALARDRLRPYAAVFETWRGGQKAAETVSVQLQVDGVCLHGRLTDVWRNGIVRMRFGRPDGRSRIRHGLDWLLASAAGLEQPLVEFQDEGGSLGPHVRPPLDATQACTVLAHLLRLRQRGLREPLPFAPRSGWELYEPREPARALARAAAQWRGNDHQQGDGDDAYLRVALRGLDSFADPDLLETCVDVVWSIYAAVCDGQVREGAPADVKQALRAALVAGMEGEA